MKRSSHIVSLLITLGFLSACGKAYESENQRGGFSKGGAETLQTQVFADELYCTIAQSAQVIEEGQSVEVTVDVFNADGPVDVSGIAQDSTKNSFTFTVQPTGLPGATYVRSYRIDVADSSSIASCTYGITIVPKGQRG